MSQSISAWLLVQLREAGFTLAQQCMYVGFRSLMVPDKRTPVVPEPGEFTRVTGYPRSSVFRNHQIFKSLGWFEPDYIMDPDRAGRKYYARFDYWALLKAQARLKGEGFWSGFMTIVHLLTFSTDQILRLDGGRKVAVAKQMGYGSWRGARRSIGYLKHYGILKESVHEGETYFQIILPTRKEKAEQKEEKSVEKPEVVQQRMPEPTPTPESEEAQRKALWGMGLKDHRETIEAINSNRDSYDPKQLCLAIEEYNKRLDKVFRISEVIDSASKGERERLQKCLERPGWASLDQYRNLAEATSALSRPLEPAEQLFFPLRKSLVSDVKPKPIPLPETSPAPIEVLPTTRDQKKFWQGFILETWQKEYRVVMGAKGGATATNRTAAKRLRETAEASGWPLSDDEKRELIQNRFRHLISEAGHAAAENPNSGFGLGMIVSRFESLRRSAERSYPA